MTKHIICTTLIVVLSLISCRDSEKQLQKSLEQAGFNRMEFEKVLVHYQSDPQKLKAAKVSDLQHEKQMQHRQYVHYVGTAVL